MKEIMFCNEACEALRIEDESKFYFEDDIFEEVDGYLQNAPCDNSGMCAGTSCPHFWKCQN